jgi:hypothetical protein
MGIDLTLLPFYSETAEFSHTVLNLGRHYKLHEKINELNMLDVSEEFTSYVSRDDQWEDTHYGLTLKDPYGNRVKYTTIKELLKVKDFVDKSDSYRNRAAWAYLKELPENIKVALFWH